MPPIVALSESLTTGLLTLAGVVIGGAITFAATVLDKRLERRDLARQSCRLVVLDLVELKAAATYVLSSNDPVKLGTTLNLPEMTYWPEYRAALARVLTGDERKLLASATYGLDFVRDARAGHGDLGIEEAWQEVDSRVVAARNAMKHRL